MDRFLKTSKPKVMASLCIGLLAFGILQLLPNHVTPTHVDTDLQEQSPLPVLPIILAPTSYTKEAELFKQPTAPTAQLGSMTNLSGVETRGAVVTIAGKPIKLRDDVEMLGVTITLNCMAVPGITGNCPTPPLLSLKNLATHRNSST